jgi:hypothetical protein
VSRENRVHEASLVNEEPLVVLVHQDLEENLDHKEWMAHQVVLVLKDLLVTKDLLVLLVFLE